MPPAATACKADAAKLCADQDASDPVAVLACLRYVLDHLASSTMMSFIPLFAAHGKFSSRPAYVPHACRDLKDELSNPCAVEIFKTQIEVSSPDLPSWCPFISSMPPEARQSLRVHEVPRASKPAVNGQGNPVCDAPA